MGAFNGNAFNNEAFVSNVFQEDIFGIPWLAVEETGSSAPQGALQLSGGGYLLTNSSGYLIVPQA